MVNFKVIAEKCLNGELSGVFVLRNGRRCNSSGLSRDPFAAGDYQYIMNNLYIRTDGTLNDRTPTNYDIVDFISDNRKNG